MTNPEVTDRIAEASSILEEQLGKVGTAADIMLGALKGFRRDVSLAVQSNDKFLRAEFKGFVQEIAVPPMDSGMSFADLEKMLSFCEDAIDGSIEVKDPWRNDSESRKKLITELEGTHTNLIALADMSIQLRDVLESVSLEFDTFNTKNIEVGHPEANIRFNRDALNVSMQMARALSERAVRLDIDLTAHENALREEG